MSDRFPVAGPYKRPVQRNVLECAVPLRFVRLFPFSFAWITLVGEVVTMDGLLQVQSHCHWLDSGGAHLSHLAGDPNRFAVHVSPFRSETHHLRREPLLDGPMETQELTTWRPKKDSGRSGRESRAVESGRALCGLTLESASPDASSDRLKTTSDDASRRGLLCACWALAWIEGVVVRGSACEA